MTSTIAITASAGANICGRTAQVRDEIVEESSATECTSITDLASITRLNLFNQSIASLQNGDFAGLTALEILDLESNDLEALPATIFAGLTSLESLDLFANPFTAGIGLPAGIFDDVLDTLTILVIAPPGRDAHFVCSRADAAAIVMATTGVTDCLRISAAQFNTALPLVDATLSGLTLSDGTDPFPLTPVFASGTTTYTVAVANSVASVTVTPTATRSGATITVNSAAVTSGSASNAMNLMPGVAVPITIVVTAADGATTATYTVMVTRAAPGLTATLIGTLTEASLFAATAPTVTVTLFNTAYEATPGTLLPSHFSVTDTVDGTVRVSDVTRDSATVATLTLAYSGEDITTAGTLSVTVAAAGHTGTDDRMTNTIAITASAGVNVCGRTAQVRDRIVSESSATECTSITDLATITSFNLANQGIASLQPGDFAGLTALQVLVLSNNDLEALPANLFAGLSALDVLDLDGNDLEALPATIFAGLTALQFLELRSNALEALPATIFADLTALQFLTLSRNALKALPATIFDGLDRLSSLFMFGNPFTADTGLPAGIFDDVLDTLHPFSTGFPGFVIDQTVRDAHFVCSRADAAAIVMVTTGVTDCLRISAAQLSAYLAPTATLTGTLTEATLFAATTPTVTVTLANTAYAAPGTLMPSHFSVTDTVDGTVSVSDATRNSDTEATLTLAYSGEDIITTAGTLSVILAAAGHTGTDDLMTSTIAITASAGVNVCGRTAQVRDEIVRRSSATECTSITDLATITSLDFSGQSIASLQNGDFAGLSALRRLDLQRNDLAALPATVFAGLTALQTLSLHNNDLESLPATIFAGLTALGTLDLGRNALEALPPTIFVGLTELRLLDLDGNDLDVLPATIFDGLNRLSTLLMFGNPFTADTGLPAGIFDDVLDTLRPIATTGNDGFVIDQTVRDAHFVCSRADVAAIVMATTGVTDCLRISAAQLNTALPLVTDATLSGLTLSDGTDTFPLTPVFASSATTYTVTVANSVTSVTVTPTTTNAVAMITVNGDTVASDSASNAINLPTPGVAVPITIVVTAADTTTAMTYTVTATRAASTAPTATLAGTLTEASLFDTPAPTVTVTLANTAYAVEGTLMQSHFSVTDTVDGTVSVSDFTRDSATVATLTLAYSGEDITTTGTLSVTLAAAGHTGTGDLMTSTIAITAGAGANANVCGRTAQVRDEIVRQSSATECASITDLATIKRLDLFAQRIASLQNGDFAGLTALKFLDLSNNNLEALSPTIFVGLTSLKVLSLGNNNLEALSPTIFVGLPALKDLQLHNNNLEALSPTIFAGLSALDWLNFSDNDLDALPATIFDDLDRLSLLRMSGNPFTADTGLPAGIFDDVLDTLGPIGTTGFPRFEIDQTVRDAHFVCSRADAAAIVMATTGVTDCLRTSAAQLNTALPLVRVDATLSGLTLSDGTDTFPLTPVFASGATTYTVAVANSVTSVTVTPTATNAVAMITVNGDTVASGSASNAIDLTAGTPMVIPVIVTAADGATRMTYMVTVTRAAPPMAVTVTLDADIAGDDIVNIAEQTAGFAITGTVDTGATVEVTLGSGSARSATVTDTIWTVDIPAGAPGITGASVEVVATAMLAGSNDGEARRTIDIDLTAPTATYAPPASLTVGTPITAITPTSPSADIDAYAVQSGTLPPGLTLAGDTGIISGAPTTANVATAEVTIRLTDTAGNPGDVLIPFPAVDMGSQTLSGFAYSSSTATVGQPVPTVTAPSGVQTGSTLSYSTTSAGICTVNSSTGTLTLVGAGDCVITVTASATPNYNEATATFTITVSAAVLPSISIAAGTTVTEGTAATFTLTATPAPAGDLAVTVTVTDSGNFIAGSPPTMVMITASTPTVILAVMTDDDTTDEAEGMITATVTPGTGYTVSSTSTASVTVNDDDAEPMLAIDSPSVVEGNSSQTPTLSYTVTLTGDTEQEVTVDYAGCRPCRRRHGNLRQRLHPDYCRHPDLYAGRCDHTEH